MLSYRLVSESGEDLGSFRASTSMWRPGDVIPRGARDSLIVVNVTDAADLDEFDAYLVVKATAALFLRLVHAPFVAGEERDPVLHVLGHHGPWLNRRRLLATAVEPDHRWMPAAPGRRVAIVPRSCAPSHGN